MNIVKNLFPSDYFFTLALHLQQSIITAVENENYSSTFNGLWSERRQSKISAKSGVECRRCESIKINNMIHSIIILCVISPWNVLMYISLFHEDFLTGKGKTIYISPLYLFILLCTIHICDFFWHNSSS